MAATLPPGIGTDAEVDQANQFLREQDWDRKFIEQTGQDPNNVRLSDDQRNQLLQLAREHGIGISDHFEIDEAGNIHPKSGIGKKLLIGAAIGGVALTGLGLAGIGPMAGLFGAGGEAAAGAGEAAAGGDIAAGAGGTAASAAAGGGSVLGKIGGLIQKGTGVLGKVGNALRAGGQSIGAASQAAGQNRLNQEELALQANEQNIQGMSASERALLDRAAMEMKQREQDRLNMARTGYMQHPFQSPFAPSTGSGAQRFGSAYMSTMQGLSDQAASDLSKPAAYDSSRLPALTPYSPVSIKDVPGATGTQQGFWEKAGNAASPIMTTIGAFLKPKGRPDDVNYPQGQ